MVASDFLGKAPALAAGILAPGGSNTPLVSVWFGPVGASWLATTRRREPARSRRRQQTGLALNNLGNFT